MRTEGYTRTQQVLHWTSALLILAMFPLGFIMARTESDTLRAALYAAHGNIGMLIAVVAVVRIILGVRNRVAPPPGLPRWNRVLHGTVHWLASLTPLLLALSGMGTLALNGLLPGALLSSGTVIPATLDNPMPRTTHFFLAWTYLALLVVHVAGVVRYQATKGDVLRRMGVRVAPAKDNVA